MTRCLFSAIAMVLVFCVNGSAESAKELSLDIGATTLTAESMSFSAGPDTLCQTATQPYRVNLRGKATVLCYGDLKISADRITIVSDGDDPTSIMAVGNVRYIDKANDNLVLSGDRLKVVGGMMLTVAMSGNAKLSQDSGSSKSILTGSAISTDSAGEFRVANR